LGIRDSKDSNNTRGEGRIEKKGTEIWCGIVYKGSRKKKMALVPIVKEMARG